MPLEVPAAYQTAALFGASIGGTNPAFEQFQPEIVYDSWLTIGEVNGAAGVLSTIGIDWSTWNASAGDPRRPHHCAALHDILHHGPATKCALKA